MHTVKYHISDNPVSFAKTETLENFHAVKQAKNVFN